MRDTVMLFKTAQQYAVVDSVKRNRQVKESQDRNMVGIRSFENVIDNTMKSCFCTVASAKGRSKFVCGMIGSEMICELHLEKVFSDL